MTNGSHPSHDRKSVARCVFSYKMTISTTVGTSKVVSNAQRNNRPGSRSNNPSMAYGDITTLSRGLDHRDLKMPFGGWPCHIDFKTICCVFAIQWEQQTYVHLFVPGVGAAVGRGGPLLQDHRPVWASSHFSSTKKQMRSNRCNSASNIFSGVVGSDHGQQERMTAGRQRFAHSGRRRRTDL